MYRMVTGVLLLEKDEAEELSRILGAASKLAEQFPAMYNEIHEVSHDAARLHKRLEDKGV